MKYFKCSKCGGSLTATKSNDGGMCVMPFGARVSGICGGGMSIEITEEEYNAQLKSWEELRNKK